MLDTTSPAAFSPLMPPSCPGDEKIVPKVARIHDTRWAMIEGALDAFDDPAAFSALDAGCNQGYFSVKLAQRGYRNVVGIDARAANIQDADLIRRTYELDNLQFRHLDLLKINPKEFGQFDVVLLLGLIFQTENPIGMLRALKSLARRMVIVEAQFAPEAIGDFDWGGRGITSKRRMAHMPSLTRPWSRELRLAA